MAFQAGDTVFIVESNKFIREAEVRSCGGGMYLVRFKDNGGGIRLKDIGCFKLGKKRRQVLRTLRRRKAKSSR